MVMNFFKGLIKLYPIEFEKEFNISAQEASEIILNWLISQKAKIASNAVDLPFKIVASHGNIWLPNAINPHSGKRLDFSINPSKSNEKRVKVHITASIVLPRDEATTMEIKRSWEDQLFSNLWNSLDANANKELNIGGPLLTIMQFIDQLAPNYDYQVPIERIEKQFGYNLQFIQQIIERFKYTGVDYVLLDKTIKVKPTPQVKVEKVEINGDYQSEVVDKVEIPLTFYLKNYGRFPTNVYLHLNTINLPSGIPYPPFCIKPGELQEKQIKISTMVQDNEYSLDILLCDNDNNNLEIPDSRIEIKINKKTSKKVKIKNLVKSVLVGAKDIMMPFKA